MNIVIMGPNGCGKTTQGEFLAVKLKIPHIQTGDIYRAIAKQNTDLGKKVSGLLSIGQLIDNATTFDVVDRHLSEIQGGFIINGFPRTLTQAQRELFPIDKVIYLRLSDEEAKKRLLLRQRADDTPEVIAERLRVYHIQTEPILDYYRGQGKLVEVDGSGTIEEVRDLIFAQFSKDEDRS